MKVDAYAGDRHFVDHLAPILAALPQKHRGTMWVHPRLAHTGLPVAETPPPGVGPIMVAAHGDLKFVRPSRRRVVFVEHGVGYQFDNGHPSYSGGRDRDDVDLFIAPNRYVEARNNGTTIVAGCPKLDGWHLDPGTPEPGTVAVSWHWDCRAAPETRWAFPHHHAAVAGLARTHRVIGHAHPKAWDTLAPWYRDHGIEAVETFDEVLARAEVYVTDASSTLYEFASLDRPVVALNAPWYRRGVDFGLRWWDHIPGEQVDHPVHLPAAIDRALDDETPHLRRAAIPHAYTHHDGLAAERAADGILDHIDQLTRPRPVWARFESDAPNLKVRIGRRFVQFDQGSFATDDPRLLVALEANRRTRIVEART